MSKSGGVALLLIGIALVCIGFMLGFSGVSSEGYDCGSVFGQATNPEDAISFTAPSSTGCADARAGREPMAYSALILGGAISFGGLVLMGRRGD